MSVEFPRNEGSRDDVIFNVLSNNTAYNITLKECRLCREDKRGRRTIISTEDDDPILAVTDGTTGELTLTPDADTWEGYAAGWGYEMYIEVEVEDEKWIAFPENREDRMVVTIDPVFT